MASLFMHIGYPKTGTTSLQAFMAQQRDAFADAGILIPDAQGNRHRLLQVLGSPSRANKRVDQKLGLAEESDRDSQIRDLLNAIGKQAGAYDSVFMSEETVFGKSKDELEILKANIGSYFETIKVIVCFRDHKSFIISDYLQRISATYRSDTFSEFCSIVLSRMEYLKYCQKMQDLCLVFGKVNVLPVFYRSSGEHSSNKTILQIIGADSLSEKFDISNRNTSMTPTLLELKRRFNPILNELIVDANGPLAGRIHFLTRDFLQTLAKKVRLQEVGTLTDDIGPEHAQLFEADWQQLCAEYGDMFQNTAPASKATS